MKTALIINRYPCTHRKKQANKITAPQYYFLQLLHKVEKGRALLVPSDGSAPNLESVVGAGIRVAPVTGGFPAH